MIPATSIERQILDDIENRTGLVFKRMGGIDTRDKAIADVVLPVLADWPDKLDDVPHRRGIYSHFNTPHAYPYMGRIISWWVTERDARALGFLTQALALL